MTLTREIAAAMVAMIVALLVTLTACGPSNETADASGPTQHDAGTPTGELGDPCTRHGDCMCVHSEGDL